MIGFQFPDSMISGAAKNSGVGVVSGHRPIVCQVRARPSAGPPFGTLTTTRLGRTT
ncbi:hypothetical protein [Nonomuraea wenchangensis]|uniref:hypothetical protein n=1 Tax=Nonomuraea wenchangensis TaxID=568860 RepID=UPI0037AC21EC